MRGHGPMQRDPPQHAASSRLDAPKGWLSITAQHEPGWNAQACAEVGAAAKTLCEVLTPEWRTTVDWRGPWMV